MAKKNSASVGFLKTVFSVRSVELTVAIVGCVMGFYGWKYQRGGDVELYYGSQPVDNNGERQLVVCVDSLGRELTGLPVSPEFINNDQNTVHDFALSYTVNSTGLELKPNMNYRVNSTVDGMGLRYEDHQIFSYSAAEAPLASIAVTSPEGTLHLRAKASYDGASKPFEFVVDTRFIVIPGKKNEDFMAWQERARREMSGRLDDLKIFDVVYAKGADRQFASNVNIAALKPVEPEPETPVAGPKEIAAPIARTVPELNAAPEEPEEQAEPADGTPRQILPSFISHVEDGDTLLRVTYDLSKVGSQQYAMFYMLYSEDGDDWEPGISTYELDARYSPEIQYLYANPHGGYYKQRMLSATLPDQALAAEFTVADGVYTNNSDRRLAIGIVSTEGYTDHHVFRPGESHRLANSSNFTPEKIKSVSYYEVPDNYPESADTRPAGSGLKLWEKILFAAIALFITVGGIWLVSGNVKRVRSLRKGKWITRLKVNSVESLVTGIIALCLGLGVLLYLVL